MKFFFPDSQDFIDPSFDFKNESRSIDRVRHRDDQYVFEAFSSPVCDGLLVSKGIVDGYSSSSGRYTLAQRHRLFRVGAREFFRVSDLPRNSFPIMGDCGAFTYVREEIPPYTIDEILQFYEECRFDYGISLDHIILSYTPKLDLLGIHSDKIPTDIQNRQKLTLELAAEFLSKHQAQKLEFNPVGVAQGWSPMSYAYAVDQLQKIGFRYIALGGMVPLKTQDILSCLEAIREVRLPETKLHLLGVTRTDHVNSFSRFGVVSFDSTSPLLQSFKDDKDNYYTLDRAYTAIRVPQVEGNNRLQKLISSGEISQDKARRLERICLETLSKFDDGQATVEQTLDVITDYEALCEPKKKSLREVYRGVLEARPWKECPCEICKALGHNVILFRGAERNRRRGFHNIWVFYRRLHRELGTDLISEENAVFFPGEPQPI